MAGALYIWIVGAFFIGCVGVMVLLSGIFLIGHWGAYSECWWKRKQCVCGGPNGDGGMRKRERKAWDVRALATYSPAFRCC